MNSNSNHPRNNYWLRRRHKQPKPGNNPYAESSNLAIYLTLEMPYIRESYEAISKLFRGKPSRLEEPSEPSNS